MKAGIFLRAALMASFLALPSFTRAEDGIQTFLEKTLAVAREKDHLPAVAALVHDMIFLVVTNAGNEAANQAIKDIGKPLKERLKPLE